MLALIRRAIASLPRRSDAVDPSRVYEITDDSQQWNVLAGPVRSQVEVVIQLQKARRITDGIGFLHPPREVSQAFKIFICDARCGLLRGQHLDYLSDFVQLRHFLRVDIHH